MNSESTAQQSELSGRDGQPVTTRRRVAVWRRMTQVSIFGLLVLATVVSIVVASESNRVHNLRMIVEHLPEDRWLYEVRHPIFETESWAWTKTRFGKLWNKDLTSISIYNYDHTREVRQGPVDQELLTRIMRLKQLRNLNICSATLTEPQIKDLGKLKSLQWLGFNATNVSLEQAQELRKQMPNTFVTCLNTKSL
jgi:hypothetical protein